MMVYSSKGTCTMTCNNVHDMDMDMDMDMCDMYMHMHMLLH